MVAINEETARAIVEQQNHDILGEVFEETSRQLDLWGIQNHPTGSHRTFKREADYARQNCEDAFKAGEGTWKHIAEEEYWEAWAEEDPLKFEAEMRQLAAVAVSAIASSRRARGA